MSQQININLGFTADTKQAKEQIKDLQSQLSGLLNSTDNTSFGDKIVGDVSKASKEIAELKVHLQKATNIQTGNLDFTKLNESLKKSGTSLAKYGEKLKSLGPAGQKAFITLANSVAQAEIPIRRSNEAVNKMWTTLKNTARWQLSSSILHGFMSTLSSAVGYAKELDESLNNIRIVTGKSIEDMARFADQANMAAKALSTTTTAYTDAALIFYQQGLNDADVKKRTDVVIKMANVTGQSAQQVSDQMTAIWNNFDNGAQSLESFADKMVALGAATASSSQEIAGGLEKFAAIGETIGLSFEYAAAALATITSNTRQSEEVVGTALKTIFARIQGLKLGETLEDGVDLNKYSEALKSVGISIFDSVGELKNMDTILNEMGQKWETLNKAQQTALAQTVGGTRQYTQLVALMDNWNKPDNDSFMANLRTMSSASGELSKQAEIYEESWQAASNRVRAEMEEMFATFADDKAFITILKSIEGTLNYVNNLIDALGGLGGVLTTIGALLTKVFSAQISQGITNMAHNIRMLTAAGREQIQQEKERTITEFANAMGEGEYTSKEDSTRVQTIKNTLTLQQQFIENEAKMSEEEKEINKILLDRNKILGEQAVKSAKAVDDTSNQRSDAKFKIQTEMAERYDGDAELYDLENTYFQEAAAELTSVIEQQEAVKSSLKALGEEGLSTSEKLQKITDELKESGMEADEIDKIEKELKESGMQADILVQKLGKLQSKETEKKTEIVYGYADDQAIQEYKNMSKTNVTSIPGTGATKKSTEEYTASIRENIRAKKEDKQVTESMRQSYEQSRKHIEESEGAQKKWADTLVSTANSTLSLVSALQMLGGMGDVWANPDMTGWEKFLSITSTLLIAIPMLTNAFTAMKTIWAGLKTITDKDTWSKALNAAATWLQIKAEDKLQKEKKESAKATEKDTQETNENTISKVVNEGVEKATSGGGGTGGGKVPLKKGNMSTMAGKKVPLSSVKNLPAGASGAAPAAGAPAAGAGATPAAPAAGAGATPATGAAPAAGASGAGSTAGAGTSAASAIGSVAAIAAAILIVVAIIGTAIEQFNEAENAAKQAAADAEKLSTAYSNAKDSYNSFISATEGYKTAVNGIKELTRGTDEYNEAIKAANEEATKLLDTYEGLQYTVDDDGLILIDEASLEAAKMQQEELNNNFEQSAKLADNIAKARELESKTTDFARENLESTGDIGWMAKNGLAAGLGTAGAGALAGAALTSWSGPGAAIGAAIGAIIGLIGGVASTAIAGSKAADEEETVLALADYYDKNNGQGFETDEELRKVLEQELKIEDTALVDSLVENRKATIELVKEVAENNDRLHQMNNQMITDKYGEDIEGYFVGDKDNKELTDATSRAMARAYEDLSKELYEEEFKDQSGGLKDAEIQKQYAEAMGWDAEKTDNLYGNKATYYDKNGQVVAEELSDEVARAFLAQQKAMEQLEGSIPEYVNAVDKFAAAGETFGEEVGAAFLTFVGGQGGDFGILTKSQFENVSKMPMETQKDKEGNVVSFTIEGKEITDKTAELLGYETANQMYEAFEKEIERVTEKWDDIIEDLEKSGVKSDELEIISDLDLNTAEKFAEQVEKMNYGSAGNTGAQEYVETIYDLIEASNMGEADIDSFITKLTEVDWTDWNAGTEVVQMIEDMGYELGWTTEQIQAFIDKMRSMGGASPVQDLREDWENLALLSEELQGDGIQAGDVLSEEKYQAILSLQKDETDKQNIEDSFMATLNGQRKYVGSEDLDFSNVDMKGTLQKTRDMSKLYEAAKDDAKDIDFEKYSTFDYVSTDDISKAEDATEKAEETRDEAKAEHEKVKLNDLWDDKTDENAYNDAEDALEAAEEYEASLRSKRNTQKTNAIETIDKILESSSVKDMLAYNNFDEDRINQIKKDIEDGKDAGFESLKEMSRQANIFMAAGDAGEYDISAAEEKIASTAESLQELKDLQAEFELSDSTYGKAAIGLYADAANEAESIYDLVSTTKEIIDATEGSDVEFTDYETYTENLERLTQEGLEAAQTLGELEAVWAESTTAGAMGSGLDEFELDYQMYADNLIRLGENYSICADEIDKFNLALQTNDKKALKAAEEALEATIMLGEAAEELGVSEKELSVQSKQLAKQYGLTEKEAAQLTIENQRMNKGVASLVNNWGDWRKELQKSDKTTNDWAKAAAECSSAIADLVGASEDLELPQEFFDSAENLALIDQAAKGSEEAINKLGAVVAAAQVQMLQFSEGMRDASGNLIDEEQFGAWQDTILNGITNLQDALNGINVGDDVYEQLGGEDWVNALNQMAIATNMSVDEMNSILNSLGVQAEVTTTSVEQDMEVPTYTEVVEPAEPVTVYDVDSDGREHAQTRHGWKKYTVPGPPKKVKGYVQVAQISTEDNTSVKGGPKIKYTGNAKVSDSAKRGQYGGSGGGSGGGQTNKPSKPTKVEPTKRKKVEEETERYHEITMAIEDYNRELERLSQKKEAAWGPNKIKYMNEEIKKTKELINLNRLKTREINNNLYVDAKALERWGANYEDGRITNYDEMIYKYMDDWYAQQIGFDNRQQDINNRKAAADGLAEGATKDSTLEQIDADQEQLDKEREASNEWYDEFKNAIAQYEETDQLYKDTVLENEQLLRQVAEMRLEAIRAEIEIKVNFNERELEIINYYLDKTSDNFFKIIEGTSLTELYTRKLAKSIESVHLAYKPYNDILYAFNNNLDNISFDDVLAAAETVIPEMIVKLAELHEMDQEMLEYYGDSLSMAREEFDKYAQFFEVNATKLEHYKNMLSLIGREMDNVAIGEVLSASLTVAKKDLQANKAYYESMTKEYNALYERWLKEKDTLDEYELEMLERKLLDAKVAMTEAEEEYLTSLETVGERAKEILENNLEQARKVLEKNLTGSTFDDYMSQLDRLSKKQEEYLTNTNKLYETNKLIRKAQQDMDKTDNLRAKQQYNDYIKYIEQLQKSGNLSQFELSIAQKKYEVLQAEIALKEAQEAKNQVRLTRDNEGNYGYVYTANQDNISQAEQALEDAQNGLYNIGLQGVQDYQTKYNQTVQEAYEAYQALVEKRASGEIQTEEEFQAKVQELKQYYYEVLSNYSSMYYTAHDLLVETSANNEADYLLMGIGNLEDFASFSQQYLNDTSGYFREYENDVSEVTQVVEENLTQIKDGTHEVLVESDQLAKEIEDELIPAIEDQLLISRELTSAYAQQRTELEKTVKEYEQLVLNLQKLTDLGYQIGANGNGEPPADFSLAIKDLIAAGVDTDSVEVQKLLAQRWDKMGGVDNYDYSALMAEEYAKNGESDWYKTLKLLRDYKILKTDWSAQVAEAQAAGDEEKAAWLWKIQEEQFAMVEDFEKEIRDYLKRGGYVTDDYVQDRLKVRQHWLENQAYQASLTEDDADDKKVAGYKSNDEFMSGIQSSLGTDTAKVDQATTAREDQKSKEKENPELEVQPEDPEQTGDSPIGSGNFVYPLSKKVSVNSEHGYRNCPFHGYELHKGMDLGAVLNSNVLASDSGTVVSAGNNGGYGISILIDHGNGFKTRYSHLSQTLVKKDDIVNAGEIIGYSGSTGDSTGPHLDFEILKNGTAVNPRDYITFDTGGYTGDWGPEGRLAVLHQKEIILNAKDTENFLTATHMLREISDMLDNNALVASLGAFNLQALTLNTPADQILQQEVTIHADFPNVTDHNEIELAIDNLINAAAQHAYR